MVDYRRTVCLISVDDFLKKYPRFSKFTNGNGRVLFNTIMQPDVIIDASVLVKYNLPPILAVAEPCYSVIDQTQELQSDGFTKQFLGSVVCALMAANGFKKIGKKKSVPHALFSVGELYEIEV